MSDRYAWLIWASAFLVPWGVLFLRFPEHRRVMLWTSLFTAPFGLTEPLFGPEYRPHGHGTRLHDGNQLARRVLASRVILPDRMRNDRELPVEAPPTYDALEPLLAERKRFEAFLARRVHDPDVAEDLLQTALLRAVRAGDTLRDDERVTAWFYRILRNVLTDHWRSERARTRAVEQVEAVESGVVPPAQLEADVCACIGKLLETLPEQYASILRMVELQGLTPGDAAERLGLSAGNARVRLHRARSALRRRVEDLCRTCARHGCLDCTCRAKGSAPEV